MDKGRTSRSHEIDEKGLHEELGSSDRTGKPVKSEDIRVMHAHDGTREPVKSSASTHTQWKNSFLPNIVTLYLRNNFENSQYWSDEMWRMAGGGGHKKTFRCCADSSGQEILYLRALQGHSRRNLIDPSLQDNVMIPDNFFKYIYQVGCAINLHSIINSGLIPGGQKLSKRQTVFFLLVNPME